MIQWILALLLASGVAVVEPPKAPPEKNVLPPEEQKKLMSIVSELNRRAALFSLSQIGVSGSLPSDPRWEGEKTSNLMLRLQPVASDDRHEVFDAPNTTGVQANIRATAAILPETTLEPAMGTGVNWTLNKKTMQATHLLCNGEKFATEDAPAVCTAFLVAPQVVATAGHCINYPGQLRDNVFVFGFDCIAAGNCRDVFSVCDVYHGISVARQHTGNIDWALIKLDRAVTGRTPVVRGTVPAAGTGLYMTGHPAGGPAKYIDNGHVLTTMGDSFTTDLDGFEANSGSPVFETATDKLVGVFITAGATFTPRDDKVCNLTVTCGEACPAVAMNVDQLANVSLVGTLTCP